MGSNGWCKQNTWQPNKWIKKAEGWKRNGQLALLGTPVETHIMRDGLVAHAPDMYLRARGQHLRVPKLRPEPTEQASPAATGGPAASSGGPAEPTAPPGGFALAKSTVTLREAPGFRRITVNIYTFGLRFGEASFGVQLASHMMPSYRQKHLSAQEQQRMDEELIRRWSSGLYHNVKGAVLVLSALCFHDPNEKTGEASGMRNHLGTRPANIRCLRGNKPDLRRLCRAVNSAINRCNKDVIEILVFCKSGRHRSVALGACLQLALQADSRVEASPHWIM